MMKAVINDPEALQGAPELAIAPPLSVGRSYERLTRIFRAAGKRTGASPSQSSTCEGTTC